ncbi:Endoribonuclease L-PSP/chorismate mutase-like protein [Syncephalastrum racemosum]|uniref:Endoribonuclease L-PSP/chorismate mutase-like protein n=1 Tax=Syncephalastrum racemosum TaxID=13706 RepID=A0A1X2HDG2_SYNRA|nr:Endoribonuclease L-PSP/chorismate mutase-like protein [Syncephalastrum racemosum]
MSAAPVKESVFSKKTAPIGAPYSQAIKFNGLIFVSGTCPIDTEGNLVAVEPKDVQKQTHQVLKNISGLLEDCGSDMSKVLKVNVFVKDMNDFKAINDVYATYFPDPKPTRTCVEVARLPLDVAVEIECIAAQ